MTKKELLEMDLNKANEMYQLAVLLDNQRRKEHALKVIAAIEKELNS
jgi:hypothetical protein